MGTISRKGTKTASPKKRKGSSGDKVADPVKLFKEAVLKSESCDFNETIRMLDAILAIDPEYRDAINYKGMMLVGTGENRKAIECFDEILKRNPADKEALNNKGIALYGLGENDEALRCIDAALALDRRYPDALMNKAVILHSLGKDEEAQKYLARARAFETMLS